jgi:hypothetical protein
MDLLAFILMTCSYLYYDFFHIQYCNGACGMLNKVSSINKHKILTDHLPNKAPF